MSRHERLRAASALRRKWATGVLFFALTFAWLIIWQLFELHPLMFLVVELLVVAWVWFGYIDMENQLRKEEGIVQTEVPVYDDTLQSMGLRDLGFEPEFQDWNLNEQYPPTVGELLNTLGGEDGQEVAEAGRGGTDAGGVPEDGDPLRERGGAAVEAYHEDGASPVPG